MLKMLGLRKAFLGCTRPSKDQFTDSRGFQRRQVFQTGCLFEASLPLNKQPPKPDFSRQLSQSPHAQATHEEWDPKVCPTHVTQTVGRAKSIHLPRRTHSRFRISPEWQILARALGFMPPWGYCRHQPFTCTQKKKISYHCYKKGMQTEKGSVARRVHGVYSNDNGAPRDDLSPWSPWLLFSALMTSQDNKSHHYSRHITKFQ